MYHSICIDMYSLIHQCIHNVWKWTYIMVIGHFHSKMSHTWQYLISCQVLHGCALSMDFLFDKRVWHALYLRYKRNLLSCSWSIVDTWKVVLSCTWQCPICDRSFVGQCDNNVLTQWHFWHNLMHFSLFRNK